jgi:hypothetical protein
MKAWLTPWAFLSYCGERGSSFTWGMGLTTITLRLMLYGIALREWEFV